MKLLLYIMATVLVLVNSQDCLLPIEDLVKHPRTCQGRRVAPYQRVRRSAISTVLSEREKNHGVAISSLVNFLLGQTTRRQIVVVYDDTVADTSYITRTIQDNFSDTIVVKYDDNIVTLDAVLRLNVYTESIMNVLLLCSTPRLLNVFEMVRTLSLESPRRRWIFVSDEDISQSLQLFLREGTQVAFASRVANYQNSYDLFSSFVDLDNQYRFQYVGKWQIQQNQPTVNSDLTQPTGQKKVTKGQIYNSKCPLNVLFCPLDLLYEDFQGRRLVVSTVNNFPYFEVETLENGTVVPLAGIDFNVMMALSQRLNFTFRIEEPPDGRWGGVEADGSVSGMVGMVAYHRAHFSINEITITEERESVTDFSNPYILEGTTLVSKAPTMKDPLFAVFRPFTPLVWFLLVLTSIVIGPIAYVISKLGDVANPLRSSSDSNLHSESIGVSNYSFNLFRNLLNQGNLIVSKRDSTRILFFFWYIFCLVIYTVYGGTLTAFMTIPAFSNQIDSPEDLLEAYEDGFVPAVQPSTSNEYFFKSAEAGVFKELWALTDPSRSFPSSGREAMEKVLTHDIVYMSGNLNTEIRTRQRGRHLFHLSREKFQVQGFGIVCRIGAPYIHNVNKVLLLINEGGLVDKWKRDEIRKLPVYNRRRAGELGVATALSLKHIQAAMYMYISGCLFALIALACEILYDGCSNGTKEIREK